MWTRRRLAVALVLVVVAAGLWSGLRYDPPGSDPLGAEVTTLRIDSNAVGEELPTTIVVPADIGSEQRDRPLLIFLHGHSEDERSYLVDEMFAALADLGPRAPVVAFPYGGESSYWHDRDDGDWGRYVAEEVIPEVVEQVGADGKRVALGGISMGGFGALNLANDAPGRFCAIGAHSPALWEDAGDAADGAFDDAEDFDANDPIGVATEAPEPYLGGPIWLDIGDEDPFLPGYRAFEEAVGAVDSLVVSQVWEGDHDSDYWNAHWDEYLDFYADALEACRL